MKLQSRGRIAAPRRVRRPAFSGLQFARGAGVLALATTTTACTGVTAVLTPARPVPAPAATPHPRDVPPPGANLTPYTVERIVLDRLPFPANTLALGTLATVYNGDGTWSAQAIIGERIRSTPTDTSPGTASIVYTRFRWTISDTDQTILALNDEGQQWLADHWHPYP